MKHLNLELEKLEQRIAPGRVHFSGPGQGGQISNGPGHSKGNHSTNHGHETKAGANHDKEATD